MSTAATDVRAANRGDVPALVELVTALGYPVTAAELAPRLDALHAAAETVLVATHDGRVVGVLTIHVTPVLHRPKPVGRLTMLVVAEQARGTGVGRALVTEAERQLTARGCGIIEVTSNRTRTDAHAFYEALGYAVTSVRLYKEVGAG